MRFAVGWPLGFQLLLLFVCFIFEKYAGNVFSAYLAEFVMLLPAFGIVFAARKHQISYGWAIFLILLSSAITIITFAQLYHSGNGINDASEWSTALYFSIVTWTTLGYGDFSPSEPYQIFASIEAIYGYIYLGLLVGLLINFLDEKRLS